MEEVVLHSFLCCRGPVFLISFCFQTDSSLHNWFPGTKYISEHFPLGDGAERHVRGNTLVFYFGMLTAAGRFAQYSASENLSLA